MDIRARRSRSRRSGSALLAAGLALTGAGLALGPGSGTASSHREAPLTLTNPLIDSVDTYAFVSPDRPDTVTMIATWIPLQDPTGGPNFYPWGSDGYRYNIKVDNNGDAMPDKTYRWTFTDMDNRTDTFLYNNGAVDSFDDENLLFKQTYTLEEVAADGTATMLVENGKNAPSNVGAASFPNYAVLRDEAITPTSNGGTSFTGQADDPFFVDLRVFDLLYGGDLSERGNPTLNGYNVNAVALQLPISEVTEGGDGSGIIGVWQTTDQQTLTLSPGMAEPSGDFVQVSRLGAPLVNEVVLTIPLKDTFNSAPPAMDASLQPVVDLVEDPLVPKLIEQIYGIAAPATPRDDLVSAFLTGIEGLNKPPMVQPAEMLRLNTGIAPSANPNRLGVLAMDTAGFPNGRRLADDVVDIELQALEGAIRTGIVEALAEGDQVNENDLTFGSSFPYLALPHSGSSTEGIGGGASGQGSGSAGGSGSSSGSSGSSGSGSAPSGGVAAGFGGLAGDSLPALPVAVAALGLVLAGSGLVLYRRGA
jgi:uncharacterized membrane protein YgcG